MDMIEERERLFNSHFGPSPFNMQMSYVVVFCLYNSRGAIVHGVAYRDIL